MALRSIKSIVLKKDLSWLSHDLIREYKFIYFDVWHPDPYHFTLGMATLNKPQDKLSKKQSIMDFCDNKIALAYLMEYVSKLQINDLSKYVLEFKDDFDYGRTLNLFLVSDFPNPDYDKLMAEYNENLVIWNEEQVFLKKIRNEWKKWSKEQRNLAHLQQFKKLKKYLKKEGILDA